MWEECGRLPWFWGCEALFYVWKSSPLCARSRDRSLKQSHPCISAASHWVCVCVFIYNIYIIFPYLFICPHHFLLGASLQLVFVQKPLFPSILLSLYWKSPPVPSLVLIFLKALRRTCCFPKICPGLTPTFFNLLYRALSFPSAPFALMAVLGSQTEHFWMWPLFSPSFTFLPLGRSVLSEAASFVKPQHNTV